MIKMFIVVNLFNLGHRVDLPCRLLNIFENNNENENKGHGKIIIDDTIIVARIEIIIIIYITNNNMQKAINN